MAKKFYAVKKGVVPGIYTTWSECQANINGFSGAIYKGFTSEEEAKKFLGVDITNNVHNESNDNDAEVIAYVDGSYEDTKKQYACGVVIFHNGEEKCFSEKFSDLDMVSMRNVAGEIEGAKRAMKYCEDNNVSTLDLYYDYEGIEKWCTGEWKARKEGTKKYKEYYDAISKGLKVRFIKVKGHSGDKYNDLADSLAKRALGIGDLSTQIKCNCNGIVANNINYSDFTSILDLLGEDFEELKNITRDIPYGIEHRISGKYKDETQTLIINFYTDKNKLYINGDKEKELFNQLSLYIVELLETDEIPEFLNTVHNLNIDADVVEDEFSRYFPNSYDLLPGELNNYLHQAVYNLHIIGNIYVGNFLVEPAIRPLEAVLKIALIENEIPIRKEGSDYDSFFVFEKEDNLYKLKEEYVKDRHTDEFLSYLSKCYSYFNKNRHTLFHWDNPKEELDTTRVLKTVEEAHTIINDSINLIDKYYKIKNN